MPCPSPVSWLNGSKPRHRGYFVHPQNFSPLCRPFFASRVTILAPHFGQMMVCFFRPFVNNPLETDDVGALLSIASPHIAANARYAMTKAPSQASPRLSCGRTTPPWCEHAPIIPIDGEGHPSAHDGAGIVSKAPNQRRRKMNRAMATAAAKKTRSFTCACPAA